MAQLVHVDTDLGGDMDDLCALGLLLRWKSSVQLVGVTTTAEEMGRRAGYVRYVLDMEGETKIPVCAGADQSGKFYSYPLGFPPDDRYWPAPIPSIPGPQEKALSLLQKSIDLGARIIAIGPYTNLSLLEQQNPGILHRADIYLMGGYVYPVREGFPQWGQEMDFNMQVDIRSAQTVLENSDPLLIPLSVTVETALRRSYLPVLRNAGRLGELIANQALAFADEYQNEVTYGLTCAGLPDDIINFQHDPLACAIACGWREGVVIEELPLSVQVDNGLLAMRIDTRNGNPFRVVTRIDPERFNAFWLEQIKKPEEL